MQGIFTCVYFPHVDEYSSTHSQVLTPLVLKKASGAHGNEQ